jgi:hypothetical protein
MAREGKRSREGARRFLRRGSIPLVVHGLAEYGLGVLFIIGPSALSFDSDTAKVASILIGAGIVVMAALTDYPTALVRRLPLDSHIVLDFVLSLFVVASPFILGFTDDATAVAFFLILGIAYLALTVLTRYRRHEPR